MGETVFNIFINFITDTHHFELNQSFKIIMAIQYVVWIKIRFYTNTFFPARHNDSKTFTYQYIWEAWLLFFKK